MSIAQGAGLNQNNDFETLHHGDCGKHKRSINDSGKRAYTRGLAVVFGSAPSRARCRVHRSAPQSPRRSGRSLRGHARTDWGAHRGHERGRGDRHRHDAHDKGFSGLPPADDNPRRRPANCARLRRHNRRSVAHPPIASGGAYLGLVPRRYQSGEVDYVGGISNAATGGCGPCCTRSPTRT
jgi:hypothetical protein